MSPYRARWLARDRDQIAPAQRRAGVESQDAPSLDGDGPGAPRPAAGAHALLALQRAAGNRAVSSMLGSRVRPPDSDQAAAQARGHRPTDVADGRRSPDETAAARRSPAPTPASLFGRRDPKPAGPNPFKREVQRYTTTDGLVANAASVIGLGGPAASLTGAVTFESSGFTASVAKALAITKTGTDLTIDSQTYTASGTVKASGPKDRVGAYEIGFLQTVYESSRNFYYEPTPYTPGLLARLAPTWFGDRKKIADTLSTQPVRDGDAGKRPWYGMETVDQFAKTDPSTKASTMSDTPGSFMGWKTGSPPSEQHLVKTDGYDKFRSWLAVKDKSSQTAIPLNYADWQVDYGTTVAFNKVSPGASVVTPTATSGSKVTGTGDSSGGKWPIHTDPVANDVTTTVTTVW